MKERLDLKNEAVKIDGSYIEDMISGYTTLKSLGREALTLELDSYSVGTSDGETLKGTRYPARTITVEFLLIGADSSELLERLNHLNNLLSMDEADFVFNDEPDKFYTGIPITGAEIEKGRGWVHGKWQIYCADPFKYSTAVITADPVTIEGNTATFAINYMGTYPSRPVLRAEFAGALEGGDYSDDGDCGYVAFIDSDENIIQLGNPDAIDIDEFASAQQLINRAFTTIADWNTTGGKTYGNKVVAGSVSTGNIVDAYWNKGKGKTATYAKPSYGSGTAFHGPILWQHTDGALNFDLAIVHRLCVSKPEQVGTFEAGVYNVSGSTYKMVAGIVIEKTAAGTNGTVRYIVNGASVGTDTIDLSYYNTNFGYCKRTEHFKTQYYNKKKKKWQDKKIKKAKTRSVSTGFTYTQSNLNTTIKKAGGQVTFKVGNLAARTFKNADIEQLPAHNVSFHFSQKATQAAMHTNAVESVRFTRNPSAAFADIPNVFTAGDIVEADCNDASVYLMHAGTEEGHSAQQFGALGNDWEDFKLQKGTNYIQAVWSDWVNPDYAPQVSILFNEVFV